MKVLLLLLALIVVSCSSATRYSSDSSDDGTTAAGKTFRGMASYYADKFNGRQTSSGDIFDNSKFTAAHLTLPFYTKVKVTNLKNGKSIVVVINDRGPFAGGRIIDLSKAAAEAIDMIRDGVVEVEVIVLN